MSFLGVGKDRLAENYRADSTTTFENMSGLQVPDHFINLPVFVRITTSGLAMPKNFIQSTLSAGIFSPKPSGFADIKTSFPVVRLQTFP
jgi:hypothetical protein